MGREEAGKSNAIATPKRQKSWKHRKHLEKRRFSIFMGLLSPICCVWSGSFIQWIVFHQCYAGNSFHPFGQYKRSVCRSICRNKSISHQQKSILNLRICRRCRIPIVHCPPADTAVPVWGKARMQLGSVYLALMVGMNAVHLFTFPNHLVVSGMNAATFFA